MADPLDTGTPILVDCEPACYRRLSRAWHDRGTVQDLDEALHQLELERAAQLPVISMTVTGPPEGIPRGELATLARGTVAEWAGPGYAGRIAFSGRKLRDYLLGSSDPIPAEPLTDELPVTGRPGGAGPVTREVRP